MSKRHVWLKDGLCFSCSSIEEVLEVLPHYIESLHTLPANLKDKFLHLMTKRGLVSDENITHVSCLTCCCQDPCGFSGGVAVCVEIFLENGLLFQVLHPKVKSIDLSECDITDRCLEAVAACCPNLRKIDLNSTKQDRTTITSRGKVPFCVAPESEHEQRNWYIQNNITVIHHNI